SNLQISDPRMGLNVSTSIWMYVSGGNSSVRNEYNDVMSGVAKLLGRKGPSLVPDTFFIPNHPLVSPAEPFYKQGIRRAFAGRGSPQDIVDATRIAYLVKECKPYGPAKYAQGWFGQDCNAFVGNYQGVSPNVSIGAYAKGYGISDEDAEEEEGI